MRKSFVIAGAAVLLASATSSRAATLGQVLPLGDSLCYGDAYPVGLTSPAGSGGESPVAGGWRTAFYDRMTAAGVGFAYVGDRTGNASPTLAAAGQTANNGWPGYNAGMVDQGLTGLPSNNSFGDDGHYLDGDQTRPAVYPSTVLLDTGTNDCLQNIGPSFDVGVVLDHLLRDLTADRPDARVYLMGLIPNLTNAGYNASATAWNAAVPAEVATVDAAGGHVTFVPMWDQFLNADGTPNLSLYSDAVHPDQAGYDMLGNAFAGAVLSAVPEPTSVGLLAAGAFGLLGRRRRRS